MKLRKVYADEEVTVIYARTRYIATESPRRWMLLPLYYPRWVKGILAADMCPGALTGSIAGATLYADGCPSVSVATGNNPYNLSGQAGAAVLLLRLEDGTWDIVQVQHQDGYFAYDVDVEINANCSLSATLLTERISYMLR